MTSDAHLFFLLFPLLISYVFTDVLLPCPTFSFQIWPFQMSSASKNCNTESSAFYQSDILYSFTFFFNFLLLLQKHILIQLSTSLIFYQDIFTISLVWFSRQYQKCRLLHSYLLSEINLLFLWWWCCSCFFFRFNALLEDTESNAFTFPENVSSNRDCSCSILPLKMCY